MIIDFQQGIVSYPSSGSTQVFLSRSGQHISLSVANGRVDLTFAHGDENYFHTEGEDVPSAWGPLDPSTDYWLYWDIDLRTAQRTFGFTTLQPVISTVMPTGQNDLHWFNTATKKMNVFSNGRFRECLRVFAARVNNSTFTPLGTLSGKPFAGSQVGLNVADVFAGRILIDTDGKPMKRANGSFFTSESKFFFNGTPINTIRLESSITHATASQNIARFQVVAMSDFGEVRVAGYEDLQTAAIALCMTSALTGEVTELCVQGMVTNPDWNWTEVGIPLWVNDSGDLTSVDPHIASPILHPEGKPPVARVFSATSVYFDQGLGGKGEPGRAIVTNVVPATTGTLGTVRLTVPPIDASQPVVVTTNDPRMTNARTPTAHTHTASAVTTTPIGDITGTTLDVQLEQLAAKVASPVKSFIWNQGVATGSWVVTHNQNNLYPVISVFQHLNTGEFTTMPADLFAATIVDANTIRIDTTSVGPMSGRVHIMFADPAHMGGAASGPPTISNAVFVNLCDPANGTPMGTLTASGGSGITQFRFANTLNAVSQDTYFTVTSSGVISITAAGAAAMPISQTYAIQAGDATNTWSSSASVEITAVGVNAITPDTWVVTSNGNASPVVTATKYGGISLVHDVANVTMLNNDGTLRWSEAFTSPTWTDGYSVYTTDVLCGTLLVGLEAYAVADGAVVAMALNPTTGAILWQRAISAGVNLFEYTSMITAGKDSFYINAYRASAGNAQYKGGLLKFDKTGALLWQKMFADNLTTPQTEITAIAVTSDDFVYVTLSDNNSTSEVPLLYVAQINPAGALQWVIRVDGVEATQVSISATNSSQIVIGTASAGAAVVLTVNDDGSVAWIRNHGAVSVRANAVDVDSDGNVYALVQGGSGYVLYVYDAVGTLLFVRNIVVPNRGAAMNTMCVRGTATAGNVYIGGVSNGSDLMIPFVISIPTDGSSTGITAAGSLTVTYGEDPDGTTSTDATLDFPSASNSHFTYQDGDFTVTNSDLVIATTTLVFESPVELGPMP